MNSSEGAGPHRLQLTLRKPPIGWYPKPTVVFGGRGYPAQWGAGTWQIPEGESPTISVYLFNRLWKFGAAESVIDGAPPVELIYSAPILPFGRGRMESRILPT